MIKKIAIVEDDMDQARLIAYWLRPYGFEPCLFISAELFLESIKSGTKFDLLLVDWVLPGMDGLSLIKTVSSHFSLPPTIFVTLKNKEFELASALHAGADDFISKPLSKTVLIAKTWSLLRRYGHVTHPFNDSVHLDQTKPILHYQQKSLRLSKKEYQFLSLFLHSNANTVFSRTDLIDALWSNASTTDNSRALDLMICRLRAKLNQFNPTPFKIVNQYGQGYMLEYNPEP
ncbi:response regulator transcription factor [Nitrincola alkalisediminis]|uniref:response regulator transcription factor n=1 Tax=Nitrincola alkalisediminis TaxID=1366656 RepID=UPI001874AA98|nr:response regulator transcription factor [Nitrincola alkalisediminis]